MSKQKPGKPNPCFPKLPIKSPAADQLEVSIYQGGAAVIQEERELELSTGRSQVQLEGLPVAYVPNSLTIVGGTGPGKFSPGSASYRPANLNLDQILQQSVGQEVKFVKPGSKGAPMPGTVKAVLGRNSQVLVQTHLGLFIVNYTDLILPESVPASLSPTPAICFNPTVNVPGEYNVHLLYETNNLSWNSRYCLFFDEKSSTIERLDCLISLNNRTGADFFHAQVKLMAGENTSSGGHATPQRGMVRAAAFCSLEMADGGAPPSEVVGDMRMYILPEAVTLRTDETQQTALLNAEKLPVKKSYFLPQGSYLPANYPQEKQPVMIKLCIQNAAENGLGYALPAGPVDIYQKDSTGSYQKTGNANTDHVSDKEEMKLTYGPAADLKATRTLISSQDKTESPQEAPLSTSLSYETAAGQKQKPVTFRIEQRELAITNYRTGEDVEIEINEAIPHNAELLQKPEGLQLLGSAAVSGRITVKAGESVRLPYSIKYCTSR